MQNIRIVCISDTHGDHDELVLPEADLLVHAGDLSRRGRRDEIERFGRWLEAQPCTHKVVIAGNHDFLFERDVAEARAALGPNILYLQDEAVTVCGLRIYGSPWQPVFFNWAFNAPRGEALRKIWAKIPDDTDVLVTHGPPWGCLDQVTRGDRVGCRALRDAVGRVKPALHVFGHIHESAGVERSGGGLAVNASACAFRGGAEAYTLVELERKEGGVWESRVLYAPVGCEENKG